MCSFPADQLIGELTLHILQTTMDTKLWKKGVDSNMMLTQVIADGRNNEHCKCQNEDMERVLLWDEAKIPAPNLTANINSIDRTPVSPINMSYTRTSLSRVPPSQVPPPQYTCHNSDLAYPLVGGQEACTAYGKDCHECGRKNHFSRFCRSKKQNTRQYHLQCCGQCG